MREELESHLDVGDHCVKDERPSETLYDKLRRDWADRFTTSVNVTENEPSEPNIRQSENVSIPALHTVIMGWALHRPRVGSIRLTDKVKKYLTAKFDLGEQSGLKLMLSKSQMICARQEISRIEGCLNERSG